MKSCFSLLSTFVLILTLVSSVFAQGPFGFERGMTRSQVIALVGTKAVDTENSTATKLVLNTAPKPNSHFETYGLLFSPTQGLLKIVALGKDIEAGDSGTEVRLEFAAVHDALVQKYGKVTKDYNILSDTGYEFWMLDMRNKNATLSSFWNFKTADTNGLKAIGLEAHVASNLKSGYCVLSYEFDGWEAFVDNKEAQQNSNF